MKKKTLLIVRIILCILTVTVVLFIFINSLLDADLSTNQSAGVREFINSLLHSLNIPITFSEIFIRKCAHFTEYFVLGTLLFFTVKSFVIVLDNRMMYVLPIGLVIASIDETLQLFSFGRSGQISDVMLDFSAVFTAFLIMLITSLCKVKKRKEGQ